LQHFPDQLTKLIVHPGNPLGGLPQDPIAQGMDLQGGLFNFSFLNVDGGGHSDGFRGES
jgi:hypothetical protein